MLALIGVGFLGLSFLVALVSLRAIRSAPLNPTFLQWMASDGAMIVIAVSWVLAATEFFAALFESNFDPVIVAVVAIATAVAVFAFRWLLRRDDSAVLRNPDNVRRS